MKPNLVVVLGLDGRGTVTLDGQDIGSLVHRVTVNAVTGELTEVGLFFHVLKGVVIRTDEAVDAAKGAL